MVCRLGFPSLFLLTKIKNHVITLLYINMKGGYKMKKSPDCLIIYNSLNKKSNVISTSNKRGVMRAILKQLDCFETDIRIYSAYMEDSEQTLQYSCNTNLTLL